MASSKWSFLPWNSQFQKGVVFSGTVPDTYSSVSVVTGAFSFLLKFVSVLHLCLITPHWSKGNCPNDWLDFCRENHANEVDKHSVLKCTEQRKCKIKHFAASALRCSGVWELLVIPETGAQLCSQLTPSYGRQVGCWCPQHRCCLCQLSFTYKYSN